LFSGVSGINTNGNALNIIGDNVATSTRWDSSAREFFDLLSVEVGGTKIGTGSRWQAAHRKPSRAASKPPTAPPIWRFRGAACLFSRTPRAGLSIRGSVHP
jgi:hypothetical protein